jgi:D,D-heptose 1,7-bisphosphate phosphatase
MGEKAVFLDRDGTIVEDPGYINNPDMVKLLPGAAEALIHLKRLGFKLVVASNQSGVARGIIREDVLTQVTDRMKQLLGNQGVYLDAIYYCPYHPDGAIEKYRRESDERKPMPGMLLRAAKEMNIDLGRSWAIGDSYRDVEAGRRAGCRTILLNPPLEQKRPGPGDTRPDFEAVNLKEAANIIHRQELQQKKEPDGAVPETAERPLPDVGVSMAEAAASPVAAMSARKEQAVAAPATADKADQAGSEPATAVQRQKDDVAPAGRQRTEALLEEAVRHLKGIHQQGLFEEFSALKLVAGVLQMLVVFCAVAAGWLWLSPGENVESVFISLGFGILLQLMAMTLYISGR